MHTRDKDVYKISFATWLPIVPVPPSTAPISVGFAFLLCFRVFQISAVIHFLDLIPNGFSSFLLSEPIHRLHFHRLPGSVFDPPRRETAGRVTRWPCLWRNWKIDNLRVSDITGSETGLQFSYLFGSKLHQAFLTHPNDFRNSFFGTFPYILKKILRYISVHGDM